MGKINDISNDSQSNYEKSQEELRIRTQELSEAQKIAKIGSWYMDLQTNEVTWSEELFLLYGADPNSPVPSFPEFEKMITPESWKLTSERIERCIKHGEEYSLEIEARKKDGSHVWFWAKGEPVFDDQKNIIALRGMSQDISARKNRLRELEELKDKATENEKLLRTIAENFPNSYLSIMEKNQLNI